MIDLKKIRFRFVTYFTVGLLLFLIYFALLFITLIWFVFPSATQTVEYVIEPSGGYVQSILILAFCFITGGLLFSFFFVGPLSFIIGTIGNLSRGEYIINSKAFKKDGTLKWSYFLYREVITNIDVLGTALKEAEIEREQLETAKRDWIAGVSHDLKTPLSYVNGYSSLLLNENYIFDEDEKRTYLSAIYAKGAYIEKLIDDFNLTLFIDDAGKVQLKYAQIELIGFLKNLLADIANNPKAQPYELGFDTTLSHLDVVMDETLMYRALYNILINCVEHNPEGTKIDIILKQSQEEIYIDVTDNGVGIDQEMADNIFDKYYSSKSKQTGSRGLGLFIAKQMIEAQGGTLSIKSTKTKGTTFHITIKSIHMGLHNKKE